MVLCVAKYCKKNIYLQCKQRCKKQYSFKESSLQLVTKTKKHRLKDRNKNRKHEETTSVKNRKQKTKGKVQENRNRKTKAMKTKNNVKKAILRSVAVVVSFVLISFTVNAQDFWKRLIENSSFNDIAIAMVETSNDAEFTNAPAESLEAMYFENEVEPKMELEAWMTDYSLFDVGFQYEIETEPELGVEDWMMDENLFQTETEVEGSMELEAWMTSEKVWDI